MQILISCSREIVMLKHLSGKQIFGGGGGVVVVLAFLQEH
jgi:hypothetical protein